MGAKNIWQMVADLEAAGDLEGAIALAKIAEQVTDYKVLTNDEIAAAKKAARKGD